MPSMIKPNYQAATQSSQASLPAAASPPIETNESHDHNESATSSETNESNEFVLDLNSSSND